MQNRKMSLRCPNCKTFNPVGEKHCLNCGKWLLETTIRPFTYVPQKRKAGIPVFTLQFIVFIALFSSLFLNKINSSTLSPYIIIAGIVLGICSIILLIRKLITNKGVKVKIILCILLIALEVMFIGGTIAIPQGAVSTTAYNQPL
jgi:hypothetical protein